MIDNELQELEIIDEKKLEDMIYTIRGQKVMLDFELAKLYGYTTGKLNEQVKNNLNKFPPDFRFQITKEELNDLSVSKNRIAIMQTSGMKGGRTTLPYAFTEQGIYMLMTVLKGEIATEQSIRIIRVFKTMKDIIADSSYLLTTGEMLKMANNIADNSKMIHENSGKIRQLENKQKIAESQLKTLMDNLIDPSVFKQHVLFNGQRIEADEIFRTIYSRAKHSVFIVDDYINNRT